MYRSNIITQYESKVAKKGKKILYLVLKKKNFAEEIISSLQSEVERRFKKFLNDIAKDLENVTLEDEENGLKYIMLKGMINILNEMLKERMVILSEKDKSIINEIFEDDDGPKEGFIEEKKFDQVPGGNKGKNNQKNNKGNFGHSSGKNTGSPNNYGYPKPYGNQNSFGYPNPYGNQNAYGHSNPYGNQNAYGSYP